MTDESVGPRCGNNPNTRLTDGDRQAVADARAYLADRAALRDRIAKTLAATELKPPFPHCLAMADAVLTVLPAPADRAAVLLEAADDLDNAFGDPMVKHIGKLGASHLRRRAREIEATQASETGPETPRPTLRERHRAAWNALTPAEQGARIAALNAIDAEVERCDGCGHAEHPANECSVTQYGERCACDEPIDAVEGRQDGAQQS